MGLSAEAKKYYQRIDSSTKLGDLRKIASEIKKNHPLAIELWSTGEYLPRLLAILAMDPKLLSQQLIDGLSEDMQTHPDDERTNLIDWLMANQLTKDKKTVALMLMWNNSPSALQRRTFWYYQGRLRWVGQAPPPNTEQLLSEIERKILDEQPEVQWAMNFTAGWIGIFDKSYRDRCVTMGEKFGLYKDEVVARNCSPNYLPKFIEMEVDKRKL